MSKNTTYGKSLLDFLDIKKLNRIYGNSHSTLIGLCVDWWLKRGKDNLVLEGVPQLKAVSDKLNCENPPYPDEMRFRCKAKELIKSDAKNPKCVCDALFANNDGKIKGLLEVEGTKYAYILEKVAEYFRQANENQNGIYGGLEFAVVVFYPTTENNSFENYLTKKGKKENIQEAIEYLFEQKNKKNRNVYIINIIKKKDLEKFKKKDYSDYYQIVPNEIERYELKENSLERI